MTNTFWQDIDTALDLIEAEKPSTFDGVKAILDAHAPIHPSYNPPSTNPDRSFFAGSGGDRTLYSALRVAGWRATWSEADYHYEMHNGDSSEFLRYVEGDVIRKNYKLGEFVSESVNV